MHISRLDPGESLIEVVSGLVMTLSFTLAAGLATGAQQGSAHTLLLAAVGCNIAWGIIDGAFYIMNTAFERSRRARLLRDIAATPSEDGAMAAIRRELDPALAPLTQAVDRERLYRSIYILLQHGGSRPTGVTRDDLLGALAIFGLVVATTVPAVLPFLLLDDPWAALRASNLLLVALLFVAGYHWARYINANPWLAGLGLMSLGLALVAVALALGG